MPREIYTDLLAFLAVARERNFTRAAAQLGVSQSAVSHAVRALEKRLGVRLLARTTRSVSLTEAGERLLGRVGHQFEEIDAELHALSEFREKPTGTLRITASDHAIETVVWPKLKPFLRDYPDIRVELNSDYGLTDIVTQRFDAGVRMGDQVAQDMIAVRIAPDVRFALVGAPSYLRGRTAPESPQDLANHRCINLRLPTRGGLYAWEFERDGREVAVRVDGQLVFDDIFDVCRAAVDGFGLGYMPEDVAIPYIEAGRLVRLLDDWCPLWPGYHLYYPNRQPARAMELLIEALRQRA